MTRRVFGDIRVEMREDRNTVSTSSIEHFTNLSSSRSTTLIT
jgi:hypothetical protein